MVVSFSQFGLLRVLEPFLSRARHRRGRLRFRRRNRRRGGLGFRFLDASGRFGTDQRFDLLAGHFPSAREIPLIAPRLDRFGNVPLCVPQELVHRLEDLLLVHFRVFRAPAGRKLPFAGGFLRLAPRPPHKFFFPRLLALGTGRPLLRRFLDVRLQLPDLCRRHPLPPS